MDICFGALTDESAMADLLDSEDSETEEIMCSHSRIGAITTLRLERFKNVARVCLRQNSIQEIDGLAPLAATLKDLDLYDNLITHMRGIDELTNLTSLDLSFNKIKHIQAGRPHDAAEGAVSRRKQDRPDRRAGRA